MHARSVLAALGLVAAAMSSLPAAAAGCTDTFNMGSMGPPGVSTIGNAFYGPQHFNDCYNFTLNSSADAFGLSVEWDWSIGNDINLGQVSLSGPGGVAQTDTAPGV